MVGKGENAENQHFLLFPPCFSAHPKTNFNFLIAFKFSSASALDLDQSKFLQFGRQLKQLQTTG